MFTLAHRDRTEDLLSDIFKPTLPPVAVDVLEEDTCFKVLTNVPGIPKENIELDFKTDTLTIKVNNNPELKEDTANYLLKERRSASWSRSIIFSKNIDPDTILASLKDGVLTVQINKVEAQPKKKITIN
jgi:HSP20 family protein